MKKQYQLCVLDEFHMQIKRQGQVLYTIKNPLKVISLSEEEFISISAAEKDGQYVFTHLTPKKQTHIFMEDCEALCDGKVWLLKRAGYQELYSCQRKRRITDIKSAYEVIHPKGKTSCVAVVKASENAHENSQECLVYLDEALQMIGYLQQETFVPIKLTGHFKELSPDRQVNLLAKCVSSNLPKVECEERVLKGTWKKVKKC